MRISYLIAALTTFIVCAIGNTENYNAFAAACQHNSINPDALDTRYRYAIFDMSPPRTAVAQCYPGFTHMEVVVGRIVTVAGGRDFQATLFDLVIDENGKAAANSEPWQANYHLGPEGDWRPNRSQHTWSVAGKGQVLPEYDDNYIHNIAINEYMRAHGTTYSTVVNANNCWTFALFMATRITSEIQLQRRDFEDLPTNSIASGGRSVGAGVHVDHGVPWVA